MFQRLALTLLAIAAFIVSNSAEAQLINLNLKASAGGVARLHAPVNVTLTVGKEITAAQLAQLAKGAAAIVSQLNTNTTIPAQVTVDPSSKTATVTFIMTKAGPREAINYRLVIKPGIKPVGESFAFKDGEGFRDLVKGKQKIWRHMNAFDPARHPVTYKTFHHVYRFDGKGYITKGPGGRFTHHRGIYLGYSKTRYGKTATDFWHVKGAPNQSLRHAGYNKPKPGDIGSVYAFNSSQTRWTDPKGHIPVSDTKAFRTYAPAPGLVIMDFDITIRAKDGDVYLDGDPQHAGFQFRAVNEVTKTKARYIYQASAEKKGGDVWADCNWVVNQYAVEGTPYAVVHMNHPKNPKPVYSTRNYGRFGAFFKYNLKAAAPLRTKYRLMIIDPKRHTESTIEHFESLFQSWVKPVKVTIVR